jgi:hypothetical protein
MVRRVHRVDFNPVEFLQRMQRLHGAEVVGVGIAMWCLMIIDQGPIAEDVSRISRAARDRRPSDTRRSIEKLIAAGEVTRTQEGLLIMPDATEKLAGAQRRMAGLGRVDLGTISERSRNDLGTMSTPVARKINGLAPVHESTTTTTKKDTVTTTESDAARARNESGGGVSIDLERLRRWRVPDELEARLQKQRPDITTAIMRERTREWRDYAAAHDVPRNFERSWFGWQMATPRRHRVRSM